MSIKNSEKTIYVHIGLSKTGTTSIQGFLFKNRDILEKYGVCYPVLDSHARLQDNTIPNIRWLHSRGVCKSQCAEDASVLFEQVKNSQCRKFLFSDEFLSSDYEISRFLFDMLEKSGYKFTVIVYLRPIVAWHASMYYQDTKTYTEKIVDYATSLRGAPCARIATFIERYGKENVIIRPYEKCQWRNGSLLEDFLSVVGLDLTEDFNIKSVHENTSRGRNTAELMKIVRYLEVRGNKFSVQRMEEACIDDVKVVESLTDAEILAETEKYAPDFKKLANLYGKESFFVNDFPSCYGKERPVYDKITLSIEQYHILLEALEVNRQEKAQVQMDLENLLHKPYALQSHVSLTALPDWDEKNFTGQGSVFFTLAQYDVLIKMLQASRQEKQDMVKQIEELQGFPYVQKRAKRKRTLLEKLCSFRREKGHRVIHLLGFKIKFKKRK